MRPRTWHAHWIALSGSPHDDLGVFAFRCKVDARPSCDPVIVRVSADQRYKLYANHTLVGFGPQRGDLQHWFYETYDLAPYLGRGENWLTALVWNFGRWAPMAQISARTGFVFEGDGLGTPGAWEVARVPDWGFDMMHAGVGEFYIDVGPGEIIASAPLPETPWSSRLEWRSPHVICRAEERGSSTGGTPWMLTPRTLPPMRYDRREATPTIRRGFLGDAPSADPTDRTPLRLPLRIQPAEPLLLDYAELLTAYPRFTLSADSPANVVITYDEALWNPDGTKGDRDDVVGKHSRGYQDRIVANAAPSTFEPLWWRTYRYLRIETDAPTILHDCQAIGTGYPLEVASGFEASDPWVARIWTTGIRTLERCAGETYFDCPYYEQLQYLGDTRIQALIGYYLGRDRRLQRNAVETLAWSLMPDGQTQSRYPSRQIQIIPPFSLFWVLMLADQLLYDIWPTDLHIQRADEVLRAWDERRHEGQHWHFYDWVPEWPAGVPPEATQLGQLLGALAQACAPSSLLGASGRHESGPRKETETGCTRSEQRTPSGENDSLVPLRSADLVPTEHAEALVRLLQLRLDLPVSPWPHDLLAREDVARCTYYFSYYKHLAMFARPQHDAGDTSEPARHPFDYLTELQPWKEMIESGLTTFAETPEPTRSDCHAWSAHPLLGFFQIVAGVTSSAPCWSRAKVVPHPGSLKRFRAEIAHPSGQFTVAYENGRLHVESPVPFELVWKRKVQAFPASRFDE